jgi:hypothetical protein
MGHDAAPCAFPHGCGTPGVVVVAVRDEEAADLVRGHTALRNVPEKTVRGTSAPGIHQGRFTADPNEVDGRILRGGQTASSNLKHLFGNALHTSSAAARRRGIKQHQTPVFSDLL